MIERLPIDIFLCIRDYLMEEEYLHFTSCNRNPFQLIRYETIRFTSVIDYNDYRWITGSKRFLIVSKKLKNKSKQSLLKVLNVKNYLQISQLANEFRGIHTLFICSSNSTIFDNNFDFGLFNNVQIVQLKGFKGITKITNEIGRASCRERV